MAEGDPKTPDLNSGHLAEPEPLYSEQPVDKEKADLINNVRSLVKCMDIGSAEKFLQENNRLPSFMADEMIESGKGRLVAEHLHKFENIDQQSVAERLMKSGLGWAITENWSNFTKINRKEVALSLIEKGEGWAVARDIDTLREFDRDVFLKLIQSELDPEETDNVYSNVWGLKDLDEEIANALIAKKQSWVIAQHIDKFKGLDHKKIVLEIIKAEGGGSVAQNMDKFEGLDHNEIALKIIEAGDGWHVAENLHSKFHHHAEASFTALEHIDHPWPGGGAGIVDRIDYTAWGNHLNAQHKVDRFAIICGGLSAAAGHHPAADAGQLP